MAYCKERDIPVDFANAKREIALFDGCEFTAHLL